ncbi:MAG: FemAB family XrtA/PEP-CTERM system-associated protein [bacterium]
MLRVCELTVNDEIYWDEYVQASPCSTPYHLSGWKRIVEKTFGHKPYYLLARKAAPLTDAKFEASSSVLGTVEPQATSPASLGERVVGVLPCFLIRYPFAGCSLISLPFTSYGGILADNSEVEQELLSEMKRIANALNADYLELRNITLSNAKDLCLKDIYATFVMDIESDLDSMWDRLLSKNRNMIRKALKASLTVDINRDYLKDFYPLFVRRMRDLGTQVYSLNLFRNIMEEWKTATILVIKDQAAVIATGLLIPFKDTLYNPWTASNRNFLDLAPNNLFYWECITYCHENGLSHFDIGRSIWHSGTFNFKKNIGATPKQLYYQYYLNKAKDIPSIDVNNPRYKVCIKMWQRLPLWLTKMIGPGIIGHIP